MLTETLRAETASEHEAIETVPCLKRIFAEDFSREEYIDLLKKLYGFYAHLESQLPRHADRLGMLNLERRAKTLLLEQDLRFFGLSDAEIAAIPRMEGKVDFPMDRLEDALGYLYVTEGSTHGGQIMAKKIDEKLGLNGEGGVAFYASYGKEMMPMWKEFKSVADGFDFDAQSQASVVAAARNTFGAMSQWLRN